MSTYLLKSTRQSSFSSMVRSTTSRSLSAQRLIWFCICRRYQRLTIIQLSKKLHELTTQVTNTVSVSPRVLNKMTSHLSKFGGCEPGVDGGP